MALSSFTALGITLLLLGALSFRELKFQERKSKRLLAWILGFVFIGFGLFAIITDVKAEEELEYRMCAYHAYTDETSCTLPTNLEGCTASKEWFQAEAKWHSMNRFCCVHILDNPNKCLSEKTDQQKRLESLLEHTAPWNPPAPRPVLPTIPEYGI